jgi:hypothetical protein
VSLGTCIGCGKEKPVPNKNGKLVPYDRLLAMLKKDEYCSTRCCRKAHGVKENPPYSDLHSRT